MIQSDTKTCTKCKEELPKENFYKASAKKDGLHSWCRSCFRKRMKETDFDKKQYQKRKEINKEQKKEYFKENKEKLYAYKKQWREANKDKTDRYINNWRANNPAKFRAQDKRRKAARHKSTPTWLTKDQWDEMNHFYWLTKDLKAITGEEYHVDHIIPLQGKNVCGLHVPWNLQVLPKDINLRKYNKLDTAIAGE